MTFDISAQKKQLRNQIKEFKGQISQEEKTRRSNLIWPQIERMPIFTDAKTIMLYWSMDDEVYTHDFIQKWYGSKRIILPSVKGDLLELKKFSGMESMKPGASFGILEPTGEIFTDIKSIDIIIVPGIAFDKQNNRMGRGKGYYDQFLATTSAYKVGICFSFQLLETIPTENFDVRMDEVISG